MDRLFSLILSFALLATAHADGIKPGGPGFFDGISGLSSSFNGQLNLSFAGNSGNVALATALTTTRAGNAFVQNASGSVDTIGANTLRLGADEVFNSAAGAWIEEAATNSVASPTFAGASVPSTLPTNWVRGFYDGGVLTVTINSVSANSITFTLTGTANNSFFGLEFMGQAAQAVSAGQNWMCSALVSVSDTTGISQIGLGVLEYTALNTLGTITLTPIQRTNSDIPWFAQARQTIVAGPTASCGLAFQTDLGGTVNAQITIRRPQFEQRLWRSTFAASTRAADAVSLAAAYQTPYLAAASRSICIGFDAPRRIAAGTLWSEQKDASNYIELRTTGSAGATTLSLFVVSAGSTIANATLAVLAPLSRNIVCMAIASGSITTAVNNDPKLTTTITVPAGMTSTLLGSGNNGYLNSTVQSLTTWLRTLTDSEVVNNSAPPGLFDDFNRADSASLGSAPTGQAWSQTGTPFAIASKFMTNSSTAATGSYGLISFGRAPVYMGSVVAFANQANNGALALVASDGNPTVNAIANHQVWSTTQHDFGYLPGSNLPLVVAGSFLYPTALVKDGATLSGAGWGLRSFDSSMVGIEPGGDLTRIASSALTSRTGSTLWYESSCPAAPCAMPSFRSVSAR